MPGILEYQREREIYLFLLQSGQMADMAKWLFSTYLVGGRSSDLRKSGSCTSSGPISALALAESTKVADVYNRTPTRYLPLRAHILILAYEVPG
jgi:hypothetical protein